MCDLLEYIFFIDVSKEEQGNYTCYVDDVNMMRLKIVVVSKTRFLTQGQLRLCVMQLLKIYKMIISMIISISYIHITYQYSFFPTFGLPGSHNLLDFDLLLRRCGESLSPKR